MDYDDGKYDDGSRRRLLKRRETLVLLGAAVLGARGYAQPMQDKPMADMRTACVLTPEQTEGPYFVDERLNRTDIRSDPSNGATKQGVPLTLVLRTASIGSAGCVPLAGAIVDIWHCDAAGIYSDVGNAEGKKFLRGYQITDAKGEARFITIYPGWYPGRTVHIHFKVRGKAQSGRSYELTSQLYFDDAVTDRVHAQPPYAARAERRVTNNRDGLFRHGGKQLLLSPRESGDGLFALFDVALAMT